MKNPNPIHTFCASTGLFCIHASTALLVLFVGFPALAQVGPEAWYFELDGDYGSVLGPKASAVSHSLPSRNITDGEGANRHTTFAPKQGLRRDGDWAACSDWFHQSISTYMGAQSYRVTAPYPGRHTAGVDDGEQTRRSEQMLLKNWYTGTDNTRYFTLAFRFQVASRPRAEMGGFIAQLHHGYTAPPAMLLAWDYIDGTYFLRGAVYSDSPTKNRIYTQLFRKPAAPGVWHRMLFRMDPGPGLGSSSCKQCPTDKGSVTAWMMNNQTGDWEVWCDYEGQLGYHYQGNPRRFREGGELSYQWKVGHYVNEVDWVVLDYDNVAYAKRWYTITKNKLIGYNKSVLNLKFDEGTGARAHDRCWSWNGGQPGDSTRDYDNDGLLRGSVGWSSTGVGRPRRSLYFYGGWVDVPVDKTDFDFGNYVTVSAWFKTTANPAQPQGIVSIDDDDAAGKLFLARANDRLSFGVKHPDGTYSQVIYRHEPGLYADGKWHHLVGTFNRFTTDNRRAKLYIDGERVLQREGYDKPILRGDTRLAVGRLAGSSPFIGNIDEVNVLNYTMTDAGVADLFDKLVDLDSDGLPDEWELTYGFNPDGVNEALLDPDGDGLNNLQEWQAGTHPLNAKSAFKVTNVALAGDDVRVRFTAVDGKQYRLESTTDLEVPGSWRTVPGTESVAGAGPVGEVIDRGAAQAKRFYRACLLR